MSTPTKPLGDHKMPVNGFARRIDLTARNIQAQFHQEMLRIYDEASTFGYHPTYFRRMVNDHGGVQAAKMLLGKPESTEGIRRWR